MKKITVGLVVLGGLLLNNMFAAMVSTAQWQYPLDARYVNALKAAGINSIQRYTAELWYMQYPGIYDLHALTENQIMEAYKNHLQWQEGVAGPHYKNWRFLSGGCEAVPNNALMDENCNPNPNLDTYNGPIRWVPELDTVQKYCDFWLENYMKPKIKGRYERGVYIFAIEQEDYWRVSWYFSLCFPPGGPSQYLSKFFPLHDYHEYAGLSPEEKEKRMREVVMQTYKKLYEWKNENYPKIIFIHSLAYFMSNQELLGSIQDIPWVDWYGMNGGAAHGMVGLNSTGPGDYPGSPGTGSHYPFLKQMIETNYFAYTNADGVVESRQSRGWGIANTESGFTTKEAPGTPEEFLKLPGQYSYSRYYDYKIEVPDEYYPGFNVFQKYMSEWSALDRGNNYIKYHSCYQFTVRNSAASGAYYQGLYYPATFIDADWPAGKRYFTDQDVENKIENAVKSGVIWLDNFVLAANEVPICQEGDFETRPSWAWNINQTNGSVITTNRVRQSYVATNYVVYVVATSPPPRACHAANIGVGGSGGIVSSNTLRIASQVCGSGLGNTLLDFSIMAKGIPTLSGNNPMLGIYWESYDLSGNLLEEGKAFNDSAPDGKFWYVPLTNTFQNYGGYILLNNPNTDHVKVSIYNAFPLSKVTWAAGGSGAKSLAAAYCFNGPYGHDETTNRFTYWNKITKSNETATTSKYMFLRDEMKTPGGKLYDIWGGGTQWPLVIKKDGIAYDPDTGRVTVNLRNMCAENSLSAPIHIFRRAKGAGPAWNTNLYVKAIPANIDNSLVSADRIAYVGLNSYSVPGPSASTANPLTSGDNSLDLTVAPTNPVANGQRIYVYIQDTESVKGWTAFNDLPECAGSFQEGANGQIKVMINASDEDGVKMTELECSINNQNIWHPLDSANTNYLESYYDLGATPPYVITFRARAVDTHDLSSNWIYLKYYARHLDEIYVDPNSTNEMGTAEAPFRSIQDAIDMAEPGIKTFRLNKGIYNENLVLKDGVELIGTSPDLVWITGFMALNSVSNVFIDNIMFTGTNGISINSSRNIQIKRCIFTVQNTAIEMTGNSQANIERITVGNAQQGILARNNSALNITHSIITANKGITCLDSAVCVSTYNDVFCINQNYSGTSAGTGCISVNPLYTDIGDYSLKEQSPCWTAGYMQLSIGWQRINLVENSGFELGTAAWGSVFYKAVMAISSDALSGNNALKVTTPGSNYYEGVYSDFCYPVEKGKTYTASAYVAGRTAGVRPKVRICLYSERDGWTYANQTTEINWGWQKISVTKTITATNDALRIQILTWDGPQAVTLHVDKVELMEARDYRMMYNGDFELGTTAWGSAKNAALALSSDALSGNALKVTTPGSNYCEGVYSGLCYPVEKGKTYTASAYVAGRTAGVRPRVRICLYSERDGWTYANQTTELNWGWQKISVTKTITAVNDALSIQILTWDGPQAVTLHVDKVELMEARDYQMVYNGDFELGIAAWGSAKNAVLATTLESMSRKGLKVTTPGVAATEGVYNSLCSPVVRGKTYTASAYVKATQQGKVKICLYSEVDGWTYAKQVTILNAEWQKISVTKTITAVNDALRIQILTWDGPQAINLYVDNVELKEYVDIEPDANDVGCWKLDEGTGTTAHDSSLMGNNGTLQGNPQWVNGRINGALSFNGSSDYVDCGSNSSLKVSAITMEAWVYSPTTNFAGYNEIAGAEGAYGLDIWDNKIAVHINTVNQGWHWCVPSSALSWDGWHHVAFTYDGVNTVKCYRDGVLVLADTSSSSGQLQWAAWTTKLYIGQINTGGDRRLFHGLIDEVMIYNYPLTVEEIRNEWQDEDVGYWKLDEGTGTTAGDSSWRGNNGTLQGNPQWANGRINGALSLNGSNYVDCGSNSSLKVSAITMEAWVYSPTTNFAGYNEIAGAEGAYGLDIWDNKIAVHINTVNQGWHWCVPSSVLTWDGWHHVAFTYDGENTVKYYRDGVLVLTDTTSSSEKLQWAAWATKLYIGQINTGSRLFKGLLDEVKIYNRALRDYEIGNDMQGRP